MEIRPKYVYTKLSLWIVFLGAVLSSYLLVWKNHYSHPVNFIDGDPEFYYYYLQAFFGKAGQLDYEWLKPDSINSITHHPAGLSFLLLPFYMLSALFAQLFNFELNGLSLPYQVSISLASIIYTVVGLYFLSRWIRLQGIDDKISAIVVLLIFFGTNLFQYSIVEPAMSHAYSFSAICFFLFQFNLYLITNKSKDMYWSAFALGLVLFLRPNNLLILLFLPFFYSGLRNFLNHILQLLRSKAFFLSTGIVLLFVLVQLLIWNRYETQLYSDRYAAYGFYWFQPKLREFLFGFEAGFFVYTPLCLFFLFGLIPLSRSSGYASAIYLFFLFLLFYFFSAYSAYTYFDGLGIRVLVDYYSLFALLGAKLLASLASFKLPFGAGLLFALSLVFINLIYSYQSTAGILLRAGMNFNKWKYIFLKTSDDYRGVLGGSADYPPYAKQNPVEFAGRSMENNKSFDFSGKDFGLKLEFDSLGIRSNRVFMELDVERQEKFQNSSAGALVCIALEDGNNHSLKSYNQFKLNETPATACCEPVLYHYGSNLQADFEPQDKLNVYLWNIEKQAFSINKFKVKLYDYNYQYGKNDHN